MRWITLLSALTLGGCHGNPGRHPLSIIELVGAELSAKKYFVYRGIEVDFVNCRTVDSEGDGRTICYGINRLTKLETRVYCAYEGSEGPGNCSPPS